MQFPTTLIIFFATLAVSLPTETTLSARGSTNVNPNAITGTKCGNANAGLNDHDTNVALLSICGGISGKIEQCGGAPSTTTGESGTSKFTLTASGGAKIDVTKGRWEGCVRAARAACPGTFTSTCVGGVTSGNGFEFTLAHS